MRGSYGVDWLDVFTVRVVGDGRKVYRMLIVDIELLPSLLSLACDVTPAVLCKVTNLQAANLPLQPYSHQHKSQFQTHDRIKDDAS